MKLLLLPLVMIVLLPGLASADPDGSQLPSPPSIAAHPSPKPVGTEVRFLVNVIPATAKYVMYAQLNLSRIIVDESNAPDMSSQISAALDPLPDSARQKGANLIVILGQEHGVPIPLRQVKQPLILRRQSPVVTLIFFDWDPASGPSEKEKQIRFVTGPAEPARPPGTSLRSVVSVKYTLILKVNTARINKSYWAYSNISRFVKDAVNRGLDTIALGSSTDFFAEDVWLPDCDNPIRVSLSKPELSVTIFKRKE